MNDELSAILKRYHLTREDLDDHECECGNEFLCRGRKLVKLRNVDEDRQIEQFAECIRVAAEMKVRATELCRLEVDVSRDVITVSHEGKIRLRIKGVPVAACKREMIKLYLPQRSS